MKITQREGEVLAFIRKYRDEKSFSPSLPEIGIALGVTKQAIRLHVKSLIAKGALSSIAGETRTLVPLL